MHTSHWIYLKRESFTTSNYYRSYKVTLHTPLSNKKAAKDLMIEAVDGKVCGDQVECKSEPTFSDSVGNSVALSSRLAHLHLLLVWVNAFIFKVIHILNSNLCIDLDWLLYKHNNWFRVKLCCVVTEFHVSNSNGQEITWYRLKHLVDPRKVMY